MKSYIENLLKRQEIYEPAIRTYRAIGQVINTYMSLSRDLDRQEIIHTIREQLETFIHEDPHLTLSYSGMSNDRLLRLIEQTASRLNAFFHDDGIPTLPEDVLVFRGTHRDFDTTPYELKKWIDMKHFISTTRTPRIADYFLHVSHPNPDYPGDQWRRIGGTVYRILIPRGTRIIYIRGKEEEVLLPAGSLYFARKIDVGASRYASQGQVAVVDAIYRPID